MDCNKYDKLFLKTHCSFVRYFMGSFSGRTNNKRLGGKKKKMYLIIKLSCGYSEKICNYLERQSETTSSRMPHYCLVIIHGNKTRIGTSLNDALDTYVSSLVSVGVRRSKDGPNSDYSDNSKKPYRNV